VHSDEAKRRIEGARVARLATADAEGKPHIIPFVLAVEDDMIYSAVDAKAKRSTSLRRLANIAANHRVAVLVDEYDDADWSALWWARADGKARVLDAGSRHGLRAIELLVGRYEQYSTTRPSGPVIAIDVDRWTGWEAARRLSAHG
jgi:PPOX class probable F420-dependent enzyme